MGTEPAVAAARLPQEVLDLLPSPLLLIEPGTARVLFANRAAHALAGGEFPLAPDAPGYVDAYRCFDLAGRRIPPEQMPGVRVARGESFSNFQMDWETVVGRRTLILAGRVVEGVGVVTFEDVTEIEAARRRSVLLAEAGAALAASLDLEATARTVARLVVPRFADWCFVELVQPDGRIERVVCEHADPSRGPLVAALDERYPLDPDSPVGSPQVIRSGQAELMTEVSDAMLQAAAVDAEHLALLREAGFRSAMVVPLRVRGQVIGDLALVSAESGRRFTAEDLAAAQELADRCAVHIDNARLVGELRETEAEGRAILEGVADAVTAQDPQGRLAYVNDAAVQLLGFGSREELLAADAAEVVQRYEILREDGTPFPLEELPGRRVLLGETPAPVNVRTRRRPHGELRWARLQARPVHDEAGEVRLAINVIEDITELKEAELRQRFLAEAGRVLTSSLDYEDTLRRIARLAVPGIADWCAIDLVSGGSVVRVAVEHSDPAKVAIAEALQREYPDEGSQRPAIQAVLRTGEPALFAEIPQEAVSAQAMDERRAQLYAQLGLVSAMIVPMRARDRVLGAVTFVSAESGHHFDADDFELAQELALRAGGAVDNARLYQTRSAIAQTLQASLLPPVLPEVPGFALAAVYRPAGEGYEVGGDFYDVFDTDEDHWFLVMGDVCGKGAEAAAVTALARYTIRAAAVRLRSPAAILRRLSDAMRRHEPSLGRFATIACVHLDLSRAPARVTVACGGHPLPLVLRAEGEVEELGAPGMLLGLVEQPELQDRSSELRAGDALLLYTDGLTEARAPERVWSPEDLRAAVESGRGLGPRGLVDHVVGLALPAGEGELRDDVAVLGVQAEAERGAPADDAELEAAAPRASEGA
jgi:PAS domain S-box-containing protein